MNGLTYELQCSHYFYQDTDKSPAFHDKRWKHNAKNNQISKIKIISVQKFESEIKNVVTYFDKIKANCDDWKNIY